VAPGLRRAMNPRVTSTHFSIDETIRLFYRVEGSGFYAADLAVHLSATIPHGTNSMGDS